MDGEHYQQEISQISKEAVPDHYLRWLMDYERELEEFYFHLLGMRKVLKPVKGTSGEVIGSQVVWQQDRDPIMKANGAHEVFLILRGCALSKSNVVSYIEEWRLMKILRANFIAYRKTLCDRAQCRVPVPPHCRVCGTIQTISKKCKNCGIDFLANDDGSYSNYNRGHPLDCSCYNINMSELKALFEMMDNLVELALRASMQGKYIELIKRTYGSGETVQRQSMGPGGQPKKGFWSSILGR